MADEKKIIIDEDWKAQVQAEKEAAEETKSQESDLRQSGDPESGRPGSAQLPPASFELLVTMLATEALATLGQIPHPATGQLQVEPAQAQYLIDLIDVIREKTRGNLTSDEQQMIESVLHQLRLAFVESIGTPHPGPSPDHLA